MALATAPSAAPGGAQPLRAARVLLAWLTDEAAGSMLNGRANQPARPQQSQALAEARRARETRPTPQQDGAVEISPADLASHRAALASTQYGAGLFADGLEI